MCHHIILYIVYANFYMTYAKLGGIYMNMDIAALPGLLTAQDTMNQINTAILKQSLNTLEDTGASMVKMMEQSVNPNVGQNIDAYL